jgi:phosphoglycerate dehydrogenase-like enzyme
MRIAVLDDYQDVARSLADWQSVGAASFFTGHLSGENQLVEELKDFEIIVAMRERTPFPRALLEKLPNLRLLVTTGMRNRSIDVAAANARGVTVCGTPGVNTNTAELTWGLILALARQIPREDAGVRAGRWQSTVGLGLAGKTLGLLGLGSLGQHVARIGAAFGMKCIAWSQNLDPEKARGGGAERVDKDGLFRGADILSIHLVLSERTRGLVGEGELALMKRTALLVNTSRGPIVDERALAEALKRGTIAGAAIDVYGEEPIPRGHPLLTAPNTVLTPHLGYVTRENYRLYYEGAVEAIRAWQRGAPVRVLS